MRHYRNCSSRNLPWHKKHRYVYSSGPLVPGPHTRTSKRIPTDRRRRTFYIHRALADLPNKNFHSASQKNTTILRSECKDLLRKFRQYFHKIVSQGPVRDHARRPIEDFTRTSSRSSHKNLYRIMLRPLAAFLYRISTKSSHKDLYEIMHCKDLLVNDLDQDLHARTPHKIVIKALTRS